MAARREPKLEHVECKAYNHAWYPATPVGFFADHPEASLFSRCERCGTEKVEDTSPITGETWSVIYYVSDDFQDFKERFGLTKREAKQWLNARERKASRHLRAVSA